MLGCWPVFRWIPKVGIWQASLPIHPTTDVYQAETAGQKEYDHAIWWGCQHPMPKWDTSVEAPTINLIGYKTMWEEIIALYHEVYQLKRAPRTVQGDPKDMEEIHQEVFTSLKEHLQHRQGPTQVEEPGQGTASTSEQPAHQDQTHGPTSRRKCRRPMTIFGVGSRSHARRPQG